MRELLEESVESVEKSVEEFLNIWINNSNKLQPNEFDKFINIIYKLRNKSNLLYHRAKHPKNNHLRRLDIEELHTFYELIELIAQTIYRNKYGNNNYQQSKKYEELELELNCCSYLQNIVVSEINWDIESSRW